MAFSLLGKILILILILLLYTHAGGVYGSLVYQGKLKRNILASIVNLCPKDASMHLFAYHLRTSYAHSDSVHFNSRFIKTSAKLVVNNLNGGSYIVVTLWHAYAAVSCSYACTLVTPNKNRAP